jgi:hypothetical protein
MMRKRTQRLNQPELRRVEVAKLLVARQQFRELRLPVHARHAGQKHPQVLHLPAPSCNRRGRRCAPGAVVHQHVAWMEVAVQAQLAIRRVVFQAIRNGASTSRLTGLV